jgi:hypothetical protein
MNLIDIVSIKTNESSKKEEITNRTKALERLILVLRESFKISKDPNNDKILAGEGIVRILIEYLEIFKKIVKPSEQDEAILDVIHLTFGVLKNGAANEEMRKKILEPKVLETIAQFMHYFDLDPAQEASE